MYENWLLDAFELLFESEWPPRPVEREVLIKIFFEQWHEQLEEPVDKVKILTDGK